MERRFRQWMTELTGLSGEALEEWLVEQASHATERLQNPQVPLTLRTREVLLLAATGMDQRAIGKALFIAHQTVKTLIKQALGTTGCPNTTALVVYALATGQLFGVDEDRAEATRRCLPGSEDTAPPPP